MLVSFGQIDERNNATMNTRIDQANKYTRTI
jgi:hypothetical protein